MLIEALKSIPFIGWGMTGFEFIFMARKWKIDRPRIVKALNQVSQEYLI
jgi:1-acyl-sn-glycerol-3-phosphate acyltransferase